MINAASLFSGAGIAEYYLNKVGVNVVVANEISSARASAYSFLYPKCYMVNGDITSPDIQRNIIKLSKQKGVEMIIATPPCQGLSTAGANKTESSLLNDPRNTLILSALSIIDKVKPKYVIIENVPRFQKMLFQYLGKLMPLVSILHAKYSRDYEIKCDVFDAADYGVPQTRLRVVYRMWKKGHIWEEPKKRKRITLEEAIGNLPSLEAGETSNIKNHFARVHPKNQILCMRHTPTGQSAFKNKYYYPKKPDGSRIVGYGNSYKRMRWDEPAPTMTMRNEIISSQENVHPGRMIGRGIWSDARVLTLRELYIVSSLPADLDRPEMISETMFRQLVGEGVPPLLMKQIMRGIK